jgi:putative transposase
MVRRQYSAEYKAKIVLEILREEMSVSEIGQREKINPKQLQNWRAEFIEKSARVFEQTRLEKEAEKRIEESAERERELMAKIGELTIENEWMKKKSTQMYGSGWEVRTGNKR